MTLHRRFVSACEHTWRDKSLEFTLAYRPCVTAGNRAPSIGDYTIYKTSRLLFTWRTVIVSWAGGGGFMWLVIQLVRLAHSVCVPYTLYVCTLQANVLLRSRIVYSRWYLWSMHVFGPHKHKYLYQIICPNSGLHRLQFICSTDKINKILLKFYLKLEIKII